MSTKPLPTRAPVLLATSGLVDPWLPHARGQRFWPIPAAAASPRRDDSFALVFLGNAFEAPPRCRRAYQRPPPGRCRRALRALLARLL
jgi:hypothetical protein